MATEKIPFEVEASRVIDLLARQIYQTPLALLRENCQNAFDAILLRRAREQNFNPLVDVQITASSIVVSDNGIGMTANELRTHFWRAGSSGKNNPEAKAAGVVGTFGIGAMANFGIASEVEVTTQSAITGERTRSFARKSELSTSRECISIEPVARGDSPGTRVAVRCSDAINVREATEYLRSFVRHVPFTVRVNNQLVSQQAYETAVPPIEGAAFVRHGVVLTQRLSATVEGIISSQADVWVRLHSFQADGRTYHGACLLRQGRSTLMSYRTGFGLAPAVVSSFYGFGGIVDLPFLVPTAGREALSTQSLQILQYLATAVDRVVSEELSTRPEANASTGLMAWAIQHREYERCGRLRIRVAPGNDEVELQSLRRGTGVGKVRYYAGSERSILDTHASPDTPVYVIATRTPRRSVEIAYLKGFCDGEEISGQPQVLSVKSPQACSTAENAFLYRLRAILEADYFVEVDLAIGEISHGLPLLLEGGGPRPRLVFSRSAGSNATIIELYTSDFASFGSMVKDYVRSVVFPKIQHLVPSATRQGATEFLKAVSRPREVFEYEVSDLQSLGEIWSKYAEGVITFEQAAIRSRQIAQSSVQVFDSSSARPAKEVIADVIENERVVTEGVESNQATQEALPAIDRAEVATDSRVLVIPEGDESLRGFRCFVSLSDRVRDERGEFFLQPHRTSVVWGGQRVLFIFQHISGEYGLYYELQSSGIVAEGSGGSTYETCTIVMKNRIFIPVPPQVQKAFVPAPGERKRFEIRCDLLALGDG